jgi:hypothetical protein
LQHVALRRNIDALQRSATCDAYRNAMQHAGTGTQRVQHSTSRACAADAVRSESAVSALACMREQQPHGYRRGAERAEHASHGTGAAHAHEPD